ncbi:MAG: hypothetical protein M0P64_02485 [Candidatus Pacebacteria bacterium]|jgi:tetratricopeptide (TPR) repeat protein|nr:hypothetical protein [Candidatus Paceibacterota bacterium]
MNGIVRGTPFRNDSADEYEIDAAFRSAERIWETLRDLREDMKDVPLWYRCCDRFVELYLVLHLRKKMQGLLALLKTNPFTTDPEFPILVGEFLYKAERYDEAAMCFGRSLEILNEPNQDIRIRALVGKLESLIAYQERLWLCRKTDPQKGKATEILYELAMEDLKEVSKPLRGVLDARLSRAYSDMNILEMKIKVRKESEMLRNIKFS